MSASIAIDEFRSVQPVSGELDRRFILIIEDEPGICNAVALTFRHAGFQTLELSGLGGLAAATERNPFLIVLDLALANSDAVDVLNALAERKFAGAIQLVSGRPMALIDEIRAVGERRGLRMLPGLQKPFRMREIRTIAYRTCGSSLETLELPLPAVPVKPTTQIDLAEALAEGWVESWYQPKFDLQSGALIGAEGLARIRHPTEGLVLPASFLGNADPAALDKLTSFMVRRACTDWHQFKAAGSPVQLAVNIAYTQLTEMPLARMMRECMPQGRDWPGLILEVTENQVLEDIARARDITSQLKIQGVELSIDDFGHGHSNLARLKDIPFRELKLDLSLVRGCAEDRKREAMCRAAIELGHALGAVITGEGVETDAELECLSAMGCDLAQGFLLGHPMPARELSAAIQTNFNAEPPPVEPKEEPAHAGTLVSTRARP